MLCHKSVEEILHTFKKETKNLNFSVWDGKRGCLTHIAPRRRVPEFFFQFNCINYGNNVYIFKMTTIT